MQRLMSCFLSGTQELRTQCTSTQPSWSPGCSLQRAALRSHAGESQL
jgi:hypothetical protein